MKIQIIGYSGSGKSTLAKELGRLYGIEVLHLDNTKFYGDWQERTAEEQAKLVDTFLKSHASWVIDGNYTSVCPERFWQADVIIFLNFNRLFCYRWAKKRYKENRGRARDSCPCEEKFDFAFRMWILYTGRTRKRRKRYRQLLKRCSGKQYVFKSRRQVQSYLKELRQKLTSSNWE